MKTRCSHQPFSTDFRSMRSALLVSFIVLVIAPSVAFSTGGVGHPNIARGFNQYGSSTYGSIDSVNLFNGGLGLSIPIGQSFTVSEQLSYQIGIQYNSSVWNVAEDEDVCSAFPGGNWDFYAEPSPTDNAGLGWQSKFGMVLEPHSSMNHTGDYVYIDQSGASHYFFPTLHEGEIHQGFLHTRDNSYLRGSNELVGTEWFMWIEFPNGVKHRFSREDYDTIGEWRLDRMEDRFGGYVEFERILADGINGSPLCNPDSGLCSYEIVTISDSAGRTHRLSFWTRDAVGSSSGGDETRTGLARGDGRFWYLVRVQLHSNSSMGQACYRFNYDRQVEVSTPAYDCRHYTFIGVSEAYEQVDLLTKISVPDGSVDLCSSDSCTDCSTYDFTYINGAPVQEDDGRLESVSLPSGGLHEYEYGTYSFPDGESAMDPWGGAGVVLKESTGIVQRVLTDIDNDTATWVYSPQTIDPGSFDLTSIFRIVTDPLGNDTKSYFNTNAHLVYDPPPPAAPSEVSGWEYGLPFNPDVSVGTKYLSKEEFDGPASPVNVMRKSYLAFERDVVPAFYAPQGSYSTTSRIWQNSNRRVKASRTEYWDDFAPGGGTVFAYHQSTLDGFDGLGHYRQTIYWSNFGDSTDGIWADQNSRSMFVGYYPAVAPAQGYPEYWGNFHLNQSNPNYPQWPADREWILGTFDKRDTILGQEEQRTLFDFDTSTGRLKATRSLANDGEIVSGQSNLSADDILTKQTRIVVADGYRIDQRFFGADSQQLSTSDPFPAAPGTPVFLRKSEYLHGGLAKSGFYNPAYPWVLAGGLHVDRDLDSDTGWVLTDRDVSGYPTEPDYDLLGRATEVTSGVDDSMTATEYIPAYSGNGYDGHAAIRTRSYGADIWGGMTIRLADKIVVFDGFGRPWRSCTERDVDGTWNLQLTEYDSMGRIETSSVVYQVASCMDDPATPSVTSFQLDRYGRPLLVAAPDGTTTEFAYLGKREVVRTDHICTSDAGGCVAPAFDSVETTERYDSFGRLRKVVEPGAEAGAGTLISTFEYDVGGRMSHAGLTDGTTTQSRDLSYDNTGMLIEERIPERSNLPITLEHDPLGNVIRAFNGEGTLEFNFDAAARPTHTDWTSYIEMTEQWTLQEFSYHSSNAGSWNSNKLLSSVQRTPDGGWNAMIHVFDEYEYGGLFGNVDSHSTRVGTDPLVGDGPSWISPIFDISYTWDSLGNMASVAYPDVATASPSAPSRQVRYESSNGWLKKVWDVSIEPPGTGLIANLDYHVNGTIYRVSHGNGVRDLLLKDLTLMSRHRKFYTVNAITGSGADGDWNSGLMKFDGVGNIYKMGADTYFYDSVSRLVQAKPTMPDGFQHQYDHDFDAFGNLEAWTETVNGAPSTINIPVHSASNRVSGAVYDWSGNILEQSPGVSNSNQWDPLGRLSGFTSPKGEHVGFGYDTSGERIVTLGGEASIISLRDLQGRPIREYQWVRGGGTSWSQDTIFLGRSAIASEASSLWPSGGQVLHHHRDHLGSLRLLTDPNRVVVGEQAFAPFGAEVSALQSDHNLKFTGHEREPDYGWDYMHARYYTPEWGRFWSVDPIGGTPGNPQSWNSYAYVLGNPVNFIDPNGMLDGASWMAMYYNMQFGGGIEVTGSYSPYDTQGGLYPFNIMVGYGTSSGPGGDPNSQPNHDVPSPDPSSNKTEDGLLVDVGCWLYRHLQGSVTLNAGDGPGVTGAISVSREGVTGSLGGGVGIGLNLVGSATANFGNFKGWNNQLSGGLAFLGGARGAFGLSENGLGGDFGWGMGGGAGITFTVGYSGIPLYTFSEPPCGL